MLIIFCIFVEIYSIKAMSRVLYLSVFLAMHIVLYAQTSIFPFKQNTIQFYHARHIDFVENKGQWESQVRYKAKMREATVWFENDRFVFELLHPGQMEEFFSYKTLSYEQRMQKEKPQMIEAHAYHMIFEGANAKPVVEGDGVLPHYENYFIGNDPSRWTSDVKLYNKIIYRSLYDGIDLVVYEQQSRLKYDFVIAPGADASQIVTRFEGTEKLSLNNNQLVIPTSVNTMFHLKPYTYQIIDDKVVEVPCEFRLRKNTLTYHFPEGYNKDYELIIDPVWIFGSYTGSTADNWGYTATYDSDGNLYAGGGVFNTGYPVTTGAYQVNFAGGVCDIAISKFNSTGSALIYSTYLGGSMSEVPHSLIVNSQDELYIYGSTGSANFPMAGASFDNTFNGGTAYTLTNIIQFTNGSDIVLAHLSANGQQLLNSTYVGGSSNDGLNMYPPLRNNYADDCRGEILIDKNDNIYVVSTTASSNFPVTTGSFQTTYAGGNLDGCVFKMDNTLSTMLWSSFLGGSGIDAVYSISLDKFDNLIVAGGTTSTDFPVNSNAVKPIYQGGSCDGFVTRINSTGTTIVRSTYWGTNQYDQVYFVELDKQNAVFLLGQSRDATSSMHVNAAWWNPGGGQFITKLNPTLTSIVWSTIFGTGGGNVDISPTAFLVDYCNNIYLSGWGSPSLNGFGGTNGLPITANAIQSTTDNNDYYFMSIADDASALTYGSFYGGTSAEHVDGGTSRFDRMGKIYQGVCAGCGGSSSFPTTTGAWSNTNNSTNCNMGVIKIDFELPVIVAEFSNTAPVCLPDAVFFTNESYIPNPGMTTCFWDFGDGNTSTDCNPSHIYSSSGLYNVMLIMNDVNSCNVSDTVWHQVLVLSNSTDTLPDAHMCLGSFTQIGIPPYVGTGVTYNWAPATFLNSTSISNPICTAPSTMFYTLLVSDGVCTDTLMQRVNVYDIQVDAGPDTLVCSFNHMLNASSTGGGSGTQYQWSSDNQFSNWLNTSPNNSFANINVTSSGWYYVMAYNQWCSAIDSVYIDFFSIGTNFTVTEPLCFGDCNGSASVSPTAGTVPFQYSWNTGETSQSISNLCAGNYSVTITDDAGCETTGQILLEEPPPIQVVFQVNNIPCEEACVGRIELLANGGTPPYSYLWNTGHASYIVNGLCEGSYQVTITDNHNCQITQSAQILIDDIYQYMDVWADDDTLWEGQSTNLHASDIPGVSYTWTPPDWLNNPNASSPTASPPPGEYWYYVLVDNGIGCVYTDSVRIVVIDVFCYDPYIYLPNAFSPDGDGLNDILYVRGIYIEELEFLIFDRWGNLVFETRNQSVGWDGTYNGKPVDPGVYAYHLKIICFNKVYYIKKGNITLLR